MMTHIIKNATTLAHSRFLLAKLREREILRSIEHGSREQQARCFLQSTWCRSHARVHSRHDRLTLRLCVADDRTSDCSS